MKNYLASGGASSHEIEDFLDWCTQMCIQPGGAGTEKRRRFFCYRIWARLLRHRRTPFPRRGKFKYESILKIYLRQLTGGVPIDPPDPAGALRVSSADFVTYVVRHIDEGY